MSGTKRQFGPRFVLLSAVVSFLCAPPLRGQAGDSWTPISGEAGNDLRVAASTSPGPVLSSIARTGTLPNDQGQVLREYDIRTYTRRIQDQEKPEQAVIDWILRETGTDTWFGETLSLLSASRNAVRVYHTPRIQEIVSNVVDRFVNTRSEANEVVVRLVTLDSPNWRLKALPMLRPVQVQTPGVEAWLLSREDSALLIAELRKRTDFREYNSPHLVIYSGQTHTVRNTRPRTFTSGVYTGSNGIRGLGEVGHVEEGFTLQISPLVTSDQRAMDVVVKCSVDQVERFMPLWVDTPDRFGTRQRVQIQVPQTSSWRLHERFRWPVNEVLLVSRGLVARPGPTGSWTGSLAKLFDGNSPRANVLLFLEARNEIRSAARPQRMASGTAGAIYRGRY